MANMKDPKYGRELVNVQLRYNGPTPTPSPTPSPSPSPSLSPSPSPTSSLTQESTCLDGDKNGQESDIDCGDTSIDGCPMCSQGRACVTNTNCAVGLVCSSGSNRCSKPKMRRGRRITVIRTEVSSVTTPTFQNSLSDPFTVAIGDVARSDDVAIDRLSASTGTRRRSLQSSGNAPIGVEVDFTVTIDYDRTDEQQTRRDILAFLAGTETTSENATLVEVLRAAAPAEVAQLLTVDASNV